ncbi:MAG: hypothetical protein RLY92_684 [Chloroflexota bacterium]
MRALAIIILCHNSREYLGACLRSVGAAMAGIDAAVWVVDNAGDDGTPQFVQTEFPWCQVIESAHNGGYSYGNNLGLRAAGFPGAQQFRHAMLLNPDTELPADGLRLMLAYLDANPNVGVVGPKLVLADGSLDKACRRGAPTPATALYHLLGLSRIFPNSARFARYNMTFLPVDETAAVDSTVGACELLRGSTLAKVGLMDEDFFMYGEDLDLNLRIQRAGYAVMYYPRVVVRHHKGTSTRKDSTRMIHAFHDAMKIFHRKHYAAQTPAIVNSTIYAAVNVLCAYRLLRNRLRPDAARTVGSAPGQRI